MKTLSLIFILFTIIGCSSDKKNDLTRSGLKGKVRYVEESAYTVVEKFGELQKDVFQSKKTDEYNENGNKTEGAYYFTFGEFENKIIYTYKQDDKRNTTEVNSFDSGGSLDKKFTYKYDELGNRTEFNTYSSDGNLESKAIIKYDVNGNRIESNFYSSDGNLTSKTKIRCDDNGNEVETKSYDSNGSQTSIMKSEYDKNGNEIEVSYEDLTGNLNFKKTYEYIEFDAKGNWIKLISFQDNEPVKIKERIIKYYD